jgi:hypothetical protein
MCKRPMQACLTSGHRRRHRICSTGTPFAPGRADYQWPDATSRSRRVPVHSQHLVCSACHEVISCHMGAILINMPSSDVRRIVALRDDVDVLGEGAEAVQHVLQLGHPLFEGTAFALLGSVGCMHSYLSSQEKSLHHSAAASIALLNDRGVGIGLAMRAPIPFFWGNSRDPISVQRGDSARAVN